MQKYELSALIEDFAEDEEFYLATEVDELLSKRTADAAAMLVDKQARIAELEKALRFIIENDLVMRSGLGWRDSGCGCCSGPVDVPPDIDSTVKSLMVK